MSRSNTKVSGKMMVLRRKVLFYATVVISSPKIWITHKYHKCTPETPDLVMYVFVRFILGFVLRRYLMLVDGMVFLLSLCSDYSTARNKKNSQYSMCILYDHHISSDLYQSIWIRFFYWVFWTYLKATYQNHPFLFPAAVPLKRTLILAPPFPITRAAGTTGRKMWHGTWQDGATRCLASKRSVCWITTTILIQ